MFKVLSENLEKSFVTPRMQKKGLPSFAYMRIVKSEKITIIG